VKTVGRVIADPAAPLFHRFDSLAGQHVLIIPHSRIFDFGRGGAAEFDEISSSGDQSRLNGFLDHLAAPLADEDTLDGIVAPAPQSISLNVSSSCNLSCSYCYAARGAFNGAQPEPMSWNTARSAIDALLNGADASAPVTIGFLGGEPFVNRPLVHRCILYAADKGQAKALDVRFSVTTNGTLIRADDIALMRAHRMAVTISIDGGASVQNSQRPSTGRRGVGSFAALAKAVEPLLASPQAGPLFETLVLGELVRARDHRGLALSLFFWRTKEGEELDFLVRAQGRRGPLWLALEAKLAVQNVPPLQLPKSLARELPELRDVWIVTPGGSEARLSDGCIQVPIPKLAERLVQALDGA